MLDIIEQISGVIDMRMEVVRGRLVPKEGALPIPQAVIDYILSPDFNFSELLKMYDMPKTSINHRKIIAELILTIADQINRLGISFYPNDMVVKAKIFGSYYVPDITFTLANNEIYDEDGALENAVSIIEVLSKSTEEKDKTEKKEDYQSSESLQEYVLISQDGYKIEQFLRKGKSKWISKVYDSADQTCILTVGVEIKLKELYKNTDWGKI